MGKKIFVSGSVAYDFIMNYEGSFKKAILKDHLEELSIAFVAKNKKRHFGGCGGNIAYNLSLMGEDPLLYGVAGRDFGEYRKWLLKNGVKTDFVGIDPGEFTATAYVLTDKSENQITMFSPGAMESTDYEKKIKSSDLKKVDLAVLSPDICERTYNLGKLLYKNRTPFIFDPGQMTPAFKRKELTFLLKKADLTIANSYEVKMLSDRLSIQFNELMLEYGIFIETLGEKGVNVFINGKKTHIKAAKPAGILDPTGCGDSFRGGFAYGYFKGFDIYKCARIGAVLASYAIENKGTQSHLIERNKFLSRYFKAYNEKLTRLWQ